MAQIGEFAFIIAGLGVATGTTPPWIAAVAVGVSTITAFVTPYMISNSTLLARRIDRVLPDRLRTMATFYTAWLSDIKARGKRAGPWRTIARPLRVVGIDALLLSAFVIAGALLAEQLASWVDSHFGVGSNPAFALVVVAVAALCVPLLLGIVNGSRSLGAALAAMAMPSAETGRLDTAQAPRRALVVSLQLGVLLCVALPLLAVTEPFLPGFSTPVVLGGMICVLTWVLWRTATDLQGHVRAGAAMIAEALAHSTKAGAPRELVEVTRVLPGFGDLTMLGIPPDSAAAGQTLAELDLRGLSGASVIAIQRGEQRIVMPTGSEAIHAGDLVALAGSSEEVEAAIALLGGRSRDGEADA
jgi:CPA2 family monovalent cation:H+ antiporter-2